MAPTSLAGQKTTTTPGGRDVSKHGFPVHAAEMIATFKGTAYSVRCAVNNPYNYEQTRGCLKTAFAKQMSGVGFSFVEILSACPSNWHLSPADALKWIEESLMLEFPLGEFKNVDKVE